MTPCAFTTTSTVQLRFAPGRMGLIALCLMYRSHVGIQCMMRASSPSRSLHVPRHSGLPYRRTTSRTPRLPRCVEYVHHDEKLSSQNTLPVFVIWCGSPRGPFFFFFSFYCKQNILHLKYKYPNIYTQKTDESLPLRTLSSPSNCVRLTTS